MQQDAPKHHVRPGKFRTCYCERIALLLRFIGNKHWFGITAMFICICNAIREKDIRATARCNAGGAEDIYGLLGFQPQCRQCLEDAESVIADERSSSFA